MHKINGSKSTQLLTALLNLVLLCTVFFSQYSNAAVTHDLGEQLNALDELDQNFNKQFYRAVVKDPRFNISIYSSMEQLNQAINEQKSDAIKSVALLVNNLTLLKNNYDHRDIYAYLEILLDNNEITTALSLITSIEQQADSTTVTHSYYLLAHYYFQREQWQKSLQYLQDDGLNLAPQTYQHRMLIKGYSLQKLAKHRDAQKAYEKIPADSSYWNIAQFNIALVNIRQGWWSEAHNMIKSLDKRSDINNNNNAINRLNITLGYSLLHKGYYRNATKVFQQVTLDSFYANQALLGIALTAAQQDDYIKALNASRLLKAKNQDDLPIDEAHLLMPFFYEKSQQWTTASIGYTQAGSYYEEKIKQISTLMKQPLDLKTYPINISNRTTMDINKIHLDFSAVFPQYVFAHQARLKAFSPWLEKMKNNQLNQQFKQLNSNYIQLVQEMVTLILQTKRDHLNSYLDQTRFGLARLFDNNMVQQ
ncbi:hypothetical protein N8878_01900 [Psychromonas sp.]|nr:hypothetical protein [Psychromonas sp.]